MDQLVDFSWGTRKDQVAYYLFAPDSYLSIGLQVEQLSDQWYARDAKVQKKFVRLHLPLFVRIDQSIRCGI